MSRKDFELIARTVKEAYDTARIRGSIVTRNAMARMLATALSETNPQFDAERFLRACGL